MALDSLDEANVDLHYLSSFLRHRGLTDCITGSAQPQIIGGSLRRVWVNLPPLPEQRRIAEILDTLDEVIRQTERVIEKLRRMKQGLLHDLLTRGLDANGQLRDPDRHPEQFKDSPLGRIPREWEVERFSDFCRVQVGFAFPSTEYCEHGIDLIRISNIQHVGLRMSGSVSLPKKYADLLPQFLANPDDILIALSGATTGKTCMVDESSLPALINQRVGRFIITDNHKMISDFLFAIVTAHQFFNGVLIDSIGGAQPNLSPGRIEAFTCPLPPVDEQSRIVNRFNVLGARIASEIGEGEKLRTLKQGLMDDLLTGRVRVEVPEEATA